MGNVSLLAVYGLPLLAGLVIYLRARRRKEVASRDALAAVQASGITQPVSLHPVINPNRCMGCGACTRACPQGDVLGVVAGQAELVNPTHCIGHGRCAASCPTDAITLVIGTEERGVDIPVLDPHFQTSTSGIYVAGELGGMGLIRNAAQQGRRAIESISHLDGIGLRSGFDVVIVGAGPAGFAASLAAQELGLRYVTLEQDQFGGSIAHHPRGKIVVTEPVDLPLIGKVSIRETTKEWLLDLWDDARRDHALQIREHVKVESIASVGDGFKVETGSETLETRAVLLAVGRRGTPRKLGVVGEERNKVVYRLTDAEQYAGKRVLVVGGGDSAVEAATALARVADCRPVLSYRGKTLSRPRPDTMAALAVEVKSNRAKVVLDSELLEVGDDFVELRTPSARRRIGNDAVIVCAGGELPKDFLRSAGVEVETANGVPLG
jgi:thioredoxin reductase/NAD-dependent dihydropyrimidine dehydrogenase PreA subunit